MGGSACLPAPWVTAVASEHGPPRKRGRDIRAVGPRPAPVRLLRAARLACCASRRPGVFSHCDFVGHVERGAHVGWVHCLVAGLGRRAPVRVLNDRAPLLGHRRLFS